MCREKECNVYAISNKKLEDVNDNVEDGMLFLATATSKKEKQLSTDGRKGGRGGGREGRKEGKQTWISKLWFKTEEN